MERKCRHVRRVKQYRYKREYRRRGGKVINVERRKIIGIWEICLKSGSRGSLPMI